MNFLKLTFSSHGILLLGALILSSCRQGGELANESLSGGKIEDGSISGEKIADGSITPAKLDRTYQELLSPGTVAQYFRGDQTWQTLNTSVVPELTNLYYTDARSRAALSATSPVSYSSTTGVISLGTVPVTNGGTGLTSLGTANQLLGVNSGATAAEYKTISGTTNQLTVTHGAGSITLSTPQDIATGSSPTFAGMTLTGFSGFVRATTGALSASALSSSDVTTALGFTPVNIAGDTMTGTLNLPTSGLLVGTNDLAFNSGNLGVGTTTASHKLEVVVDDATANNVTVASRLTHTTTGTPAAGLGTGLDFAGERSDGTIGPTGRIQAVWSDPTVGFEDGDLEFLTVLDGTVNKVMSLSSSGNVGVGTSASPHSPLQVDGAIATAISTHTADYTVTSTDSIILANANAAAVNITLPSAVGIAGRQYTVKAIDVTGGAVTVVGTIDSAANYTLSLQWQYVTVVSDGSNWLVIANN